MDFSLRRETPSDHHEVEVLTYKAFEHLDIPDRDICDEHYLVHIMRDSKSFVPELDFVVEADGKILGNIMYTKSKVVAEDGTEHEMLTFGPGSVLPEYHNQGIGSAMISHTIELSKKLGYKGIFILGHPDYYKRFGFVNAEKYSITMPDGTNFDAFMALPLYDGALDGITGKFYYDPIYDIDREAVIEFDKEFLARL